MKDDFKKIMEAIEIEYDNIPVPEFEGYSFLEIASLIYSPFAGDSPIKLFKLEEADYLKIPMFNQIKYLIGIIQRDGELKLTNKGYLPPKIIAGLYSMGYLKDKYVEMGISKVYREVDMDIMKLSRSLLEVSGIVKKRHNVITLTKEGAKTIANDELLFRRLFVSSAENISWNYFDGYPYDDIGQFGLGFSLVLLSKYGDKKRLDLFYSQKYFKAFPTVKDPDDNSETSQTQKEGCDRCYSLRTFDRFLEYWGLVDIEQTDRIHGDKFITKTDLFDKLIQCYPHSQRNLAAELKGN